jgi:hypothetical protein
MLLACYGPSLTGHIDEIGQSSADVFTVSGAHDVLIAHGIRPRGHIECDPRAHKAKFLAKPHVDTTYFLASCCAPQTFDAVAGFDTVLWHSDQSKEEADFIWSHDRTLPLVLGGTMVGTRALSLGTALGYRRFEIYGMDCSFHVTQHAGAHPNETPTWQEVSPDGGKTRFKTNELMILGIQDFFRQVEQTRDCTYTLHGDGLLQHIFRHNIKASRVSAPDERSLDLKVA